jgi:WD40 repeat protein
MVARCTPTLAGSLVLLVSISMLGRALRAADAPDPVSPPARPGTPGTLPFGALAKYRVSDQGSPTAVVFSPGGKVVALADREKICRYDMKTGELLSETDGTDVQAYSPNGKLLFFRTGHSSHVLNVAAKPPALLNVEFTNNSNLAISLDGKVVATTDFNLNVYVWSTETWQKLQTFKCNAGANAFECLAFSPDNKLLITLVGSTLYYFDIAKGSRVFERELVGNSGQTALSPHSDLLATGNHDSNALQLWDVAARKTLLSIPTRSQVSCIRFFPNGRYLAYRARTDGSVCICDLEKGDTVLSWKIPDGVRSLMAISPDGRTLAAGNDNSEVFLWDIAQLALKDNHDPAPQNARACEELWKAVAGIDADARFKALWKLASGGDNAADFLKLKTKLKEKNSAHITALLKDLENENEAVRTTARDELHTLGDQVITELRELSKSAAAGHAKVEATALVELIEIEDKIVPPPPKTPEEQQRSLAIAVLELAASPHAKELLTEISLGGATRRECWEARQSLERMTHTITYFRAVTDDVAAAPAAPPVPAFDPAIVALLVAQGIDQQAKGKTESAKGSFLKALLMDEHNAIALFECGKILETEGSDAASDFLLRAADELTQQQKGHLAFVAKAADAQARAAKLNPYLKQYKAQLEVYAEDLSRIIKKTPDENTTAEATARVDELNLQHLLPPEKLAAFKPPETKNPAGRPNAAGGVAGGGSGGGGSEPLSADIEKELKALGWTTIKGQWKKTADKGYEVTDGKLEVSKVNGSMQVMVRSGGTGSITVFVRNDQPEFPWAWFGNYKRANFAKGYGIVVPDLTECKVYLPLTGLMAGWKGPDVYPYMDHVTKLAPSPKHHFVVSIQDSNLEVSIDGKSDRKTSYKINKDGPFTIEIKGTLVIEDPRAADQ